MITQSYILYSLTNKAEARIFKKPIQKRFPTIVNNKNINKYWLILLNHLEFHLPQENIHTVKIALLILISIIIYIIFHMLSKGYQLHEKKYIFSKT